jgi:hypothetical protein
MITQEELKRHLSYDPETGVFTRKLSNTANISVGDVAGTLCSGYLRVMILGKRYQAHRLAWLYMTGCHAPGLIDHINGDGTDNRFSNLRPASKSQNGMNRRIQKNNSSGYPGVCWHKNLQRWTVTYKKNNKIIYVGCYEELDEVVSASKMARAENFGEFASKRIE